MTFYQTYRSALYRDFKALAAGDLHAVIQYYEKHEAAILTLEPGEYFELLAAYTDALFETGAYAKHQIMSSVVLEASILHNIQHYQGEDVFLKTLFKKAASHYNLHEYAAAARLLHQLVRIEPAYPDARRFLLKCKLRLPSTFLQSVKAVSIFCFLTAALASFAIVLAAPFYAYYKQPVTEVRNALFVCGWVVFGAGQLRHYLRHFFAVRRMIKTCERLKAKRARQAALDN